MKKHTMLSVILFAMLLPTVVQAQQKLSLDLEGAKKQALEFNKSMINTEYALEKSQLAVKEAIANGLPQINASMDYSNAMGASMSIRIMPDMPPSEIPIKPQSNLYLNVNQLLFSGNYIVGVQIARLYNGMAEKNLKKSEIEILSQVSDSYYLVLVSGELLNIMKLNLDNLDALHAKTAAMVDAGVVEQTNLDQLSVQVNTLQNAVRASERQLELATNLLRLQLGASVETEIELTENLQDILGSANLEASLLKSFDLEGNIDYQLLRQQELLTAKMVDMKRSNALPTLSAFYRYTYKLLTPDFDMSPANMIGLQMNIPIFSSGVRNAQVKQAALDHKTMQNNLELLSDQLKVQEKQLRFNYANALETWENQQKNIEVSRRVYNSLKQKYEQGLISGLDLVSADNNFLRAETEYISSVMEVLSTRVKLEKLYANHQ